MISIRNDVCVSQVTMVATPCNIILSHRGSHVHNPIIIILYFCNGGVACTHVCNKINCIIIMFFIFFEYQDRL